MTCINHPDATVAAYCQNCGKPLCTACVRSVGGVVYCEPCLGARLGIPIAGQAPVDPIFLDKHPNPALAAVLGFIPGVGAMYNGQFVKALAHVLIFAVFVSLSDRSGILGIFTAAWIFYQVFDAYQTAKARRDGQPLPNPFGLNDLGTRLGLQPMPYTPQPPYGSNFAPENPAEPAAPNAGAAGAPSAASGMPPAAAPFAAPYVPPYTPPNVPPYAPPHVDPVMPASPPAGGAPIGAIALIVIGILLLFQTMGIWGTLWIDRTWPLVIVGAGAWLLYRRTRETPKGGSQ